ncbi:hypothetical protein HYH03_000934 [Edaphochlamys debaryana]|uniref:Acid phosphatase n=1 Tax=Edaphochlamys debaryana TaxID=47281 RepID=A0A836C5D4_9CHLO|nr:hypothetical protein HYH03_000934 [Edaphochlamys debaryana]|eukprot:KAG2501116.1 hypothetical protein HYH03_000934 [Edaphochlamys debaryana]
MATGAGAPLLAALLAIQTLLWVAQGELVAVYSLQRHGARNALPKGILLTEGDLIGGPTLLPRGQRMTYDAGVAFRQRYINSSTCGSTCLVGSTATGDATSAVQYGVIGQAGVGFGNFDVYVRSSALDRSIMSGLCFLNGIWPADPSVATPQSYLPTGATVVPVYTQADSDDILIRAYTKCPAYQSALEAWFRSDEFRAKENETQPLRDSVKAAMPYTGTNLTNWWNVYDSINVYRTYGVGQPTPNFTDVQFNNIQAVAFWLETRKMDSALTSNLLGGTILADLISSLQQAATTFTTGSKLYYKLLSLSGHYNTQLGLLSALAIDKLPGAMAVLPWYRAIPRLAAVLAFELHALPAAGSETPAFYVRLVAQDGPDRNYTTVPLPCAAGADANGAVVGVLGTGACAMQDFVDFVQPRALTAGQWCAACGNRAVAACRLQELTTAAAAQQNASGNSSSSGGGSSSGSGGCEDWQIAVAVVVPLVGTALLAAAGWAVWRWWQGRRSGASKSQAVDAGYGGMGPVGPQFTSI